MDEKTKSNTAEFTAGYPTFLEDEDGIHLRDVVDEEYTLCGRGVAGNWFRLNLTKRRVVTCPDCIGILKFYASVKYREEG